tara:strand:+ start:330 stop:560 length:231 start_codon:yes stop_codon:yes gene_type:complete
MNSNVGKYTYSEVKKMTIFRRYELFGCLEAEDVMKSMLKESKEEAFTGSEQETAMEQAIEDIGDDFIETEEFIKYG